jgi:hypothetical protein
LLEVDDFKPVKLKDQDLFKKHYELFPPRHSDYSYTTLVSWKDYMKYYYTFQEECIIIMTKHEDKVQFRPPIGQPSAQLEQGVMELAREKGTDPPYGVIDDVTMKRLRGLYPRLCFDPHRDFFDYVYLAQDLAELNGKKYIKIRNILNRFKKRYEYTTESINDDNIEEVCKFLERWCLWKDCDKIPLLNSEKLALFYCMEHFDELDLSGLAIRIDGNIEAVSIYQSLNKDTAIIHFEKAIPDFEGLYQAINQEAAKILSETYQFINREADMGFPGLRLAKQKYKPHHMVEVYHLKKDQLNFD